MLISRSGRGTGGILLANGFARIASSGVDVVGGVAGVVNREWILIGDTGGAIVRPSVGVVVDCVGGELTDAQREEMRPAFDLRERSLDEYSVGMMGSYIWSLD